MTEKDFLRKLRRGLGSAIVELWENPDRTKYRDIVLKCCLKNIGYDVQSEGTKGYYLYTAICALGEKDEFENTLINTFQKRLEHNLFQQIADILCLYADDGSERARKALNEKYQSLYNRLLRQKAFPFRYCEREQFEYLMICQVDYGKWAAFKQCIHDAGTIIAVRHDDLCSEYDWFIAHCENIFGKNKVAEYFERETKSSTEVRAFTDAISELASIREKNSRLRIEPEVTLESYIARAKELESDQYAYARMRLAARRFSRQASPEDFLKLVSHISDEPSDEIKANMLHVFRDADFPGDIGLLVNYVPCDCERLRDIAIDALGRFRDKRVHDLAIKLITEGNLDAGLPLLIENWHKADEKLIRKQVLQTKKVSHSMQQDLRNIYAKHHSNSCGNILAHVYEYGDCTYCRSGIVKVMNKNYVLTDYLLKECRYDSFDETRKLAERVLKSREKDKM